MRKVVVDVMGADTSVDELVKGVVNALQLSEPSTLPTISIKDKNFGAIIVGDEKLIAPVIPDSIKDRVEIVHCPDFIKMEEHATSATKRDDISISVATQILKSGRADALVSPGHSGATMSLATLRIGRIKGVSRPAICTTMPTTSGMPSMILDAGANTDCKPEYLLDFAIMGNEYAKALGFKNPRVGLLSNGEEESKGNELTKAAFEFLRTKPFFKGNVEGRDIFNGSVDVVVCDGFSGNLVLKASEGVAVAIGHIIKTEIKSGILSILGALFMKSVFKNLKKKMDHSEYGGAPLLGVQKVVIISHGSSNARAIECAIYQALSAVESDICVKIQKAFEN